MYKQVKQALKENGELMIMVADGKKFELHLHNVKFDDTNHLIFVDGAKWPPTYSGTGHEEVFNSGACPDGEFWGLYTGFYLIENLNVEVLFFNQAPLAVELPNFVELEVAQTEPGFKGDTAAGGTKPATLESGATVQVPLFINGGDRVRVDTRTGNYIERVK